MQRVKMLGKDNTIINIHHAHNKIDRRLIVAVVVLVVFGLVMIYSASSYVAGEQYDNKFFYVINQSIAAFIGIGGLIFCTYLDYHKLQKLSIPIILLSIVLLIVVLIPGVGIDAYGARRWINLGVMTLQASEPAKFGLIIFIASYMAKYHKRMTTRIGWLPILGVSGIVCLLIMMQPNLSITVCVVLLTILMLFVGGVKLKYFVVLSLPIVALVPILIIIEPYRFDRLIAFLDPWANPLDEGFQLIQSLYALGSGGMFGLGIFNSRQKFLFLPFAESDFIFSIIGEELGWVGSIAVLCLYAYIVVRAIKIAISARDRFGAYLAAGIAGIIAIQTLVNIAVVTGSIPPTGLPLPFISHGGSSLMVFLASIGILLNIKKQSHMASAIVLPSSTSSFIDNSVVQKNLIELQKIT
ncbi:MAG: putative lipid II flippase FtsW [Firmicutes bacterium]|nr:putative lipid II flippase FtsW [Bacillota bacterium]MCL1953408.1 putative lipid II flippase FtsW [Bacillota bacterium]